MICPKCKCESSSEDKCSVCGFDYSSSLTHEPTPVSNSNRYNLKMDSASRNQAGFHNYSKLDMEKQKLYEELDRFSEKSTITTLLLSLFGLHRITNGKIISGVLYMLTAGGFFIWLFVDMITIAIGKFTDQDGKYINSVKRAQIEYEIQELERKHFAVGKGLNELEEYRRQL